MAEVKINKRADFEDALMAFNRKVQMEQITSDYRSRQSFQSNSEIRRRKQKRNEWKLKRADFKR